MPKLSPEEISARLGVYAKPARWDSFDSRSFYYKRTKKGFLLRYIGQLRGMLPFRAEVAEAEGGSLISGKFPVWRTAWQTVALFFGFTVLMTPVFGIPLSMYPMIIIVLLLAVPIYAGFGGLIGITVERKKRKAVLEFIQQHLLE